MNVEEEIQALRSQLITQIHITNALASVLLCTAGLADDPAIGSQLNWIQMIIKAIGFVRDNSPAETHDFLDKLVEVSKPPDPLSTRPRLRIVR